MKNSRVWNFLYPNDLRSRVDKLVKTMIPATMTYFVLSAIQEKADRMEKKQANLPTNEPVAGL